MLGVELPVYSELHQKASIKDHLGIIPGRLLCSSGPTAQKLPWSEAEAAFLQEDPKSSWLLKEFPPGVHTRPEGGAGSPIVLMLWEYRTACSSRFSRSPSIQIIRISCCAGWLPCCPACKLISTTRRGPTWMAVTTPRPAKTAR